MQNGLKNHMKNLKTILAMAALFICGLASADTITFTVPTDQTLPYVEADMLFTSSSAHIYSSSTINYMTGNQDGGGWLELGNMNTVLLTSTSGSTFDLLSLDIGPKMSSPLANISITGFSASGSTSVDLSVPITQTVALNWTDLTAVQFSNTDLTLSTGIDNISIAVPEAATISLIGLAGGILLIMRRFRN
jgi:hypothetical protein